MRNRRSWLNPAPTLLVAGLMAIAAPLHTGHATEPVIAPFPGLDQPDSDRADPSEQALPGKDGSGPAPSSTPSKTPSKQDRADVLAGEAPPTDLAMRAEALNELYDELHEARDAAAAEPITEEIEEAWRNSGSDTVDLLMSRVDTFVLASDLDLALQVLDAVTELAPEDAEAWHQRALVNIMKNNYPSALSDLRRALGIDPNNYKAIRDLGVALRQTGDKKGALEAFRKALEVNPFFEQARQAADELKHELEGQDI
jgi:tetratricopeptide (TPR) repeat protein